MDGLVTAVVGGFTFFVAPVLGSVFLSIIPEIQRSLGIDAGWIRPTISGVLLLLVILFLPGGLAGLIPRRKSAKKIITDPAAMPQLPPLPARGTEVVSIQGLSKSYGGVRAVREVDITVAAGEILGLIGPNGAGKTTLVNMVTGLTAPTTGTGTVLGTTLSGSTKAHVIAQAGVARTFRQITLFNRLSALENVRVGLGDKAAIAAGDLSYGDQRRLEIARALASHPSLVVLGEPADGIAVLVIEHNVRMMLETCDRVMVLNCGEGIASGAPGSMAANIERVYERFPVLHERRQLAAGALSGGEQQMLAIALALIAELLADEKIIEAYLGVG